MIFRLSAPPELSDCWEEPARTVWRRWRWRRKRLSSDHWQSHHTLDCSRSISCRQYSRGLRGLSLCSPASRRRRPRCCWIPPAAPPPRQRVVRESEREKIFIFFTKHKQETAGSPLCSASNDNWFQQFMLDFCHGRQGLGPEYSRDKQN